MTTTTVVTRPRPAPRTGAGKLIGALLALTLVSAACSITWTGGVNYGVVTEVEAGRVNIEIYRAARRALHDVMYSGGIGVAADYIYASANGPISQAPELCVEGFCVGASTLHALAHEIIYDHLGDLQNAIIDATNNTDCLAVTLISYGVPSQNWTHKGVECIIGKVQ